VGTLLKNLEREIAMIMAGNANHDHDGHGTEELNHMQGIMAGGREPGGAQLDYLGLIWIEENFRRRKKLSSHLKFSIFLQNFFNPNEA
jgi:hypothetical protein